MKRLVTYCCDVGSVKAGNFGWVRVWDEGGQRRVAGSTSITDCVRTLGADIRMGNVVTLGIESPLFIPVPLEEEGLSSRRDRERDRSCFAPVGASVTTLGAHELAFIVRTLDRGGVAPRLDWKTWSRDEAGELLVWEAFVSGEAHTADGDHRRDAATAAHAFIELSKGEGLATAVEVTPPREVLSIAGAVLLWSGWSTDLALLRQPVLVVKPTGSYGGVIEVVP